MLPHPIHPLPALSLLLRSTVDQNTLSIDFDLCLSGQILSPRISNYEIPVILLIFNPVYPPLQNFLFFFCVFSCTRIAFSIFLPAPSLPPHPKHPLLISNTFVVCSYHTYFSSFLPLFFPSSAISKITSLNVVLPLPSFTNSSLTLS